MEHVTDFLWGRRSLRNDVFVKPPKYDKKKESAHTYASFGDNGMTVSINAYGHIMQMSRYLNFGCSGFLCVDSKYSTPYFVQTRTQEILDSSQMPNRGFRLDIIDWSGVQNFSSGFMYDRWPRYVINRATPHKPGEASAVPLMQNSSVPTNEPGVPMSNIEKSPKNPPAENSSVPIREPLPSTAACSLSIQYYCFENTVIQKYQLLVGDSGISRDKINWGKLSVVPELSIRSLNFVDGLDFDDEDAKPERLILSDNSITLVRTIPKEHYEQEESKQHPREDDSTDNTEQKKDHDPQYNTGNRPVAAALIISPFINDRPAKIVDGNYINLDDAKTTREEMLVITIAYTVKLLYSDCSEIFEKLPESTTNADSDDGAASVVDAQTTERFIMDPVGNSGDDHESMLFVDAKATEKAGMDDDHEMTPIPDANTGQGPVLRSDVANMSNSDTTPVQADAHETGTVGEVSDLSVKKRELVEGWASEVMEAMQEMSKVFREETTFRKICFSIHKDLDYAFRRNLEHILSVCSIPIAIEQNKLPSSLRGPAVAITCGDIAGHRIGPRASL
jgi:hypothetical protein